MTAASTLHFDSYVFDYSPLAEPIILTPAMEQAMDAALDAGQGSKALRAMVETRNRELATDPAVRELVQGVWGASGVNGVQLTLGGTSMSNAYEAVIRDIAHYQRRAEAGGDMAICRNADQLLAAVEDGQVGLLLGTQDCPIGDDLAKLDLLFELGVRVVQLTFNTRNHLGDGCTERQPAGLSNLGIEVVKRLNELGVIVDTSHCGYQTTLDAIEHSERPSAITHTTCGALAKHPRAKTDDQLSLLAEKDGYVGINLVPFFLVPGGTRASLDLLADHVEHAASVVGVQRVGVGTDWGLWTSDFPVRLKAAAHLAVIQKAGKFASKDVPSFDDTLGVDGFEAWEDWPNITAKLLERFPQDDVKGLIGGNWIDFMRRAGL